MLNRKLVHLKEEEFRNFLKKKGKKAGVIDRNISGVKRFADYLKEDKNKELLVASPVDIESYVEKIERTTKSSAKGPLYVLMNYFKFIESSELLKCAAQLREERTKKSRRIYPLKEFLGIDSEHVKKLASIGIKNVDQMLEKGKTIKQRKELSKQLDVPEEAILEIVELSDITRIGYVKTKLTRLYHNAGFDTPTKIARFEAKELYDHFKKYVEESGWEGMIPNLSDLKYNIKSAKNLKEVVEK